MENSILHKWESSAVYGKFMLATFDSVMQFPIQQCQQGIAKIERSWGVWENRGVEIREKSLYMGIIIMTVSIGKGTKQTQ